MRLNISGVWNDRSIGVLGINYCLALHKLGIDVAFFPIHPIQQNLVFDSEEDVKVLQRQISNTNYFDPLAPSLRIWHPFDQAISIGKGSRLAYCSFELNPLSKQEMHHLSSLDLAMFPSKWGCDVAKSSGLTIDVDHFPHGVNRNIFNEIGRQKRHDGQPTRFLSVGKWEIRKGASILPQIFDMAFELSDNVEFYISHFNPFCNEEEIGQWESLYKKSKLASKIKFVNWVNNPKDLAILMQHCDCILGVSHAEAWSLPLLEGMSCGLHVIATNYSGHTEFLNTENAKLIEINSLEQAFDGKFFFGQGEWAFIGKNQIDQTVEHMRNVHKLCQEGKLDINSKGIEKANELTWIKATNILVEKLSDRGLL